MLVLMQASDINALFGFRLECIERMGDQQGLWAWQRINALFNWLPLAALIEDRIVCMHGGTLVPSQYVESTPGHACPWCPKALAWQTLIQSDGSREPAGSALCNARDEAQRV